MTGATGYVDGRLVPRLLARGYDIRAIARNLGKLADVPWCKSVEVVRRRSRRGRLAHSGVRRCRRGLLSGSFDGVFLDFAAADRRSARNVVDAARRTAPGDILLSSGIETVVLQAGVVIGSGSASFEMIRHLTDRLPAMTTPNWAHNKIQAIAIRDVLHYLIEAAVADVPA